MSVDPLSSKYPMLSPYHFSNNTPIMAKDINGEDFIIITWHSSPGNQGHTALAIENYSTVLENGIEKQVANGTYTVYEVNPAPGTGNIEDFVNDPSRVVSGEVSSRQVSSKKDLMNLTFGSKSRKATGLIEFESSSSLDLSAQEVLNSIVTGYEIGYEELGKTGYYDQVEVPYNGVDYQLTDSDDNCTFNCASFAIKSASLLYGINEGSPENIKTKGGTIRTGLTGSPTVPAIDVKSYTPNQVFKVASEQGQVIKGEHTRANKQPFINQVTGDQLKNENPDN